MRPRIGMLCEDYVEFATEHLLALGELRIGRIPDPRGGPQGETGHDLPPACEGEVAVLCSEWALRARAAGVDVAGATVPWLRKRFNRVVALDQEASFSLELDGDVIAGVDEVIKLHGLFRDPDLYRWVVGAQTADGRWTEKRVPRPLPPAPADLHKLRLGVPCLFTESGPMRAVARRVRVGSRLARAGRDLVERGFDALPRVPRRPPRRTAHFLGIVSHVQRIDAVRLLRRSRLAVRAGLTGVHPRVNGLGRDGTVTLTPASTRQLLAELGAEGLLVRPMNRFRYKLDMLASKAVVSVTGHGELCYRMAEAFMMRRVLVCQDMSHVRTMFPFEHGRNVVYCRPDLGDLVPILEEIEADYPRFDAIAQQGHEDWRAFSARCPDLLRETFASLYAAS